jgi:stage III sporulation protein AE
MLISLLGSFPGKSKRVTELAGTITVACLLLGSANTLIHSAADTVTALSEYGKLLLPVMTTAMAAQGGITSSAALYTGTAIFDAILCALISGLLVPMIYVFLALAVANSALGEDLLKKLRDFLKWLVSWCLKTILYVFTGYIAVTGVVSGTTDQAALKATKLTISGVVPVVGGILSDASEAVLISAGVVKSAVGVYGMIAITAIAITPFLQIAVQYLLLKLTAAVCGIFGNKRSSELIGDFSAAMGLLLAMTGTVCLLLLISTVCFMKGMG